MIFFSAFYPFDGPIAQHLLKLGQQFLFLFVNMTIIVSAIHDLIILFRCYFQILNGMIDKFFKI